MICGNQVQGAFWFIFTVLLHVCVRACVRVDSPLQPSHDGILTMTTATVAVVGFVDDDVCNSVGPVPIVGVSSGIA